MPEGTQLPLDLRFDPRHGRDDFLVAPSNGIAHAMITAWPDWPSHTLVLVGPAGSGKTHLASIWAAQAGARVMEGQTLTGAAPADLAKQNLLIEDADRIGEGEATLFHALNLMRERGTALLITARAAPDLWRLGTKDLLSRLRQAPLLTLEAPDDDLLRAVLVKLFLDRQLLVDNDVVDYISLRLDRSLGAAVRIVEALDRAGLARQRRITRPIAADVLAAFEA